MGNEFRSFAEILRSPPRIEPEAPAISPLISQPAPQSVREDNEALESARREERFERALERLLEEIATEVVGRELLLSPVDIEAIVLGARVRAAIDRATE